MLLSTVEELNALLPANVSCNATRLLTLMQQTEESYLRPILGQSLFHAVCRAYMDITSNTELYPNGVYGLLPVPGVDSTAEAPELKLIRLLQVPLVYMTLANNATLLSVSLNDGGLNAVSADGYDAVSKEDREAFSKDCYLNAHRGLECVLMFLEEDARSANPVFLPLWQESTAFYEQNDLFLRTAVSLDRYVSISQSRETYLTVVPSIRRAQETYIRPELGDRLVDALLAFNVLGPQPMPEESEDITTAEPTEGTAEDTTAEDTTESTAEPSFVDRYAADFDPYSYVYAPDVFLDLESYRPYLPYAQTSTLPAGELQKLRVWTRALHLVSSAVAYYAENDVKRLRRSESHNDAMMALARAKDYIEGNTSSFAGVIEDSPLFHPIASTYSLRNPQPVQSDEHPASKQEPGYVHDPFGSFFL
jgi:hypothetical protein